MEALIASGGKFCNVNWALALAEFPATSKAVPLMFCGPFVVTVTCEGQVSTPDKASEHVNVTVALGPDTTPLAFGAGSTDALIVGGVKSMLRVTEVVAVSPAASVTVPETL